LAIWLQKPWSLNSRN